MKIARLSLLFLCALTFLSIQVYAQKNITVLNPSFESPDSGKVTGFDGKSRNPSPGGKLLDVPNWAADDTLIFDSGVEAKNASDGKYGAYLMGGDTSIYQNLTRRVFDNDMLKLTIDARDDYNGSLLKMELFYLDGDSATAPRVSMVSETKTLTSTMTPYSITINGSAVPLAVGHKIGILIDNVGLKSNSWMDIDNVRLTNEDPTIIEVANYSFEQPDSGKIKGWNGAGSCKDAGWTGNKTDVPGWTTDTVRVQDSGIEAYKTVTEEGVYSGFLMGGDTAVWNTTNYTILAGDVITLTVSAKNSWQATLLHLELYYIDGLGNRNTLGYSDETLVSAWADYSVGFDASTIPACVGKKLGVLIDNVSRSDSWMDFDFVRINANHNVTSVSRTQLNPSVFSLAQNYPNPFNPTTNISYTLKNSGKIRLSVFDLLGREVAVLANGIQNAGEHKVAFTGSGLSSGIYFYKLQAGTEVITKKMTLLK
jgi:hypothetical protein